jgi:adenylosuccinate synthase
MRNGQSVDARHSIVVGLGFGDEGKGTIVDALTQRAIAAHPGEPVTIVRFNGGAQAAHNVVMPNGDHHTFSQIGAGMFWSAQHDVKTVLSRFVMFDPAALWNEANALAQTMRLPVAQILSRIQVDRRAVVVTPYHKAANRIREYARGDGCHGSCGMGVGEAMRDSLDNPNEALYVADLKHSRDAIQRRLAVIRQRLHADLGDLYGRAWSIYGAEATAANDDDDDENSAIMRHAVRTLFDDSGVASVLDQIDFVMPRIEVVNDVQAFRGTIIFEGAQGILLDEWYGFHPYTTWSTCTPANALQLWRESSYRTPRPTIYGVTRTYHTRHGAGPFPSEINDMTGFRFEQATPELHNDYGRWQGAWRRGVLDLVLLQYAVDVASARGGMDAIALTHMDRLPAMAATSGVSSEINLVTAYDDRSFDLVHQTLPLKRRREDLTAQVRLRDMIDSCDPVRWPYFSEKLVDLIADTVKVPVKILSSGPTYQDKTFVA